MDGPIDTIGDRGGIVVAHAPFVVVVPKNAISRLLRADYALIYSSNRQVLRVDARTRLRERLHRGAPKVFLSEQIEVVEI